MLKAILICLFTFMSFATARAQEIPDADGLLTTCGNETTKVSWSYCVHKTPGSRNPDVLYFFHGGNRNEQDWRGPNKVRAFWKAKGFEAPTVIVVSFEKFWLSTKPNAQPASGLLDVFTDHIMPTLESKFLAQPIGVRRMWGHSMGGWNSSTLAILRPDLFKAIAMTSPAILGVSPFAPESELQAYTAKHHLKLETLMNLVEFVKTYFSDQSARDQSAPMALGPKRLNQASPQFYISTGAADEIYGPGGREFAEMAIHAGARVDWVKLSTGHLNIDAEAVARFLMTP